MPRLLRMASNNIKRDVIVVVSIKVAIVVMAAFFVFGPQQRPHIDAAAVEHQMLKNSGG